MGCKSLPKEIERLVLLNSVRSFVKEQMCRAGEGHAIAVLDSHMPELEIISKALGVSLSEGTSLVGSLQMCADTLDELTDNQALAPGAKRCADALQKSGIYIRDCSPRASNQIPGIHSHYWREVGNESGVFGRYFIKKNGNKESSLREHIFSCVLNMHPGLEVVMLGMVGRSRGDFYLASEVKEASTAEEISSIGEKRKRNSADTACLEALADLNSIGHFHLENAAGDFIYSWEVARTGGRTCTLDDFGFNAVDVPEMIGAAIIRKNILQLNDLADELGAVNYFTEFDRRVKRSGEGLENSEYAGMHKERYIAPLMGGVRALCHNDAHVGNFLLAENEDKYDAAILDPESVSFGAFGDGIAKFLLTKYTHAMAAANIDADCIMRENAGQIQAAIRKYNMNIEELREAHPEDEKYIPESAAPAETMKVIRGAIVHEALTTAMQRLKDYSNHPELEAYDKLGYQCFAVFYNSITSEERDMFDRDFAGTNFDRYISRCKNEPVETAAD